VKHPPYHLRPFKSVDRVMLIEVLRRMEAGFRLGEFVYYGLGGPFLEDIRLLTLYYPHMKKVSIEKNEETLKRQRFHQPSKKTVIHGSDLTGFIANYHVEEKSIFWLDYTDLRYAWFADFMSLLPRVDPYSVVKLTLRAADNEDAAPEYARRLSADMAIDDETIKKLEDAHVKKFRDEYAAICPEEMDYSSFRNRNYVLLLHEMTRIAASKALPVAGGFTFQVVNACYYTDSTRMYSCTGIKCPSGKVRDIQKLFRGWRFANLNWAEPEHIDVPLLSMKERLRLEPLLPCLTATGRGLARALGYRIDEDNSASVRRLKQYADFHAYLPHFIRATP